MPDSSCPHPLLLPQGETGLATAAGIALRVAVGVAALTVGSKLNVPLWPVPFTMQSFAVLVLGAAYGRKLGLASVLAYLALGAAGLPVFAVGGGIAYLLAPSAGYLLGFIPAVYIAGVMGETGRDRRLATALAGFACAHCLIFVCGVAVLQYHIGLADAFKIGVLQFLPGAGCKFCAATACMVLSWRLATKK
jgi:biotin transport system substrate-specific component